MHRIKGEETGSHLERIGRLRHGPSGELHNLEVVHELEAVHNVRVNVTAMMSAQQCFLAALAGGSYVSIFGGRVNNMGYNACGEIAWVRKVLDQLELKSQIIVGSTREALNVMEWIEAGAHVVTVLPSLLETMLVHPYTKETVQQFLRDASRAEPILAHLEPSELAGVELTPSAREGSFAPKS